MVVRVGDALVVGRYYIGGWLRRVQVYPYWTVTWTRGKYSARRLADALAIAGLLCSRRES